MFIDTTPTNNFQLRKERNIAPLKGAVIEKGDLTSINIVSLRDWIYGCAATAFSVLLYFLSRSIARSASLKR